jgi:hypothetical protein
MLGAALRLADQLEERANQLQAAIVEADEKAAHAAATGQSMGEEVRLRAAEADAAARLLLLQGELEKLQRLQQRTLPAFGAGRGRGGRAATASGAAAAAGPAAAAAQAAGPGAAAAEAPGAATEAADAEETPPPTTRPGRGKRVGGGGAASGGGKRTRTSG